MPARSKHGISPLVANAWYQQQRIAPVDDYQLLIDLHKHGYRQGPGGDAETELAIRLAQIECTAQLKVADIGCGTGASTLVLARLLNAHLTAVDFLPDFLDVLTQRATSAGLADRITTLACSMYSLPFAEEELDVLWSEGAIYNIGFEQGARQWRRFLKPGGVLVASEITWITGTRPAELDDYWQREYPEIDVASAKLKVLEQHGYSPIGYFVLPDHCWLDHYYHPLQDRFADFLNRNAHSEAAQAIVDEQQREIELYERYKGYFSYGMYIATKL